MEYLVICLTCLAVSGLTLFSGFGLGTVLVPVMTLFFPVETAIAVTAVVHFANNLFKLGLFWRRADPGVCLRFGIPAFAASLAGAFVLVRVAGLPPLLTTVVAGIALTVTPVKLVVGLLMAVFAVHELRGGRPGQVPSPAVLPLGGLLSGFFGGLSGNQGAFRSAFLLGAGLSKDAFIATGVVLACVVDVSRLAVYAGQAGTAIVAGHLGLVATATLSAFGGALLGRRVLTKVTIGTVRRLVGTMLLALSLALCLGVI